MEWTRRARAGALAVVGACVAAAPALASGGGGTPPPPLDPGPCATVLAQNPATVTTFTATITMNAQITSCSALTQPGLAVVFNGNDPGSGGPNANANFFTCAAPETGGTYTLSPGAGQGVTCHASASALDANGGGIGTATLYSGCLFTPSWSDPFGACTTPMASTTYSWDVELPAPNGGRGPIGVCVKHCR
jgi:hypothetical protein